MCKEEQIIHIEKSKDILKKVANILEMKKNEQAEREKIDRLMAIEEIICYLENASDKGFDEPNMSFNTSIREKISFYTSLQVDQNELNVNES